MGGIGVIHNPFSRRNRRNPFGMDAMGFIVGSSGDAVATKNIEDMREILRFFREREIDILAINGGDGSNSHVLTGMVDTWGEAPLPKVALLRGGTMNIAASSCGVRGSPAGLMMNLVRKFRDGVPLETTRRHLLRVDDRYGFIYGIGFVHSFLEVLYAGGKSRWKTMKLLGRAVGSTLVRGKLYRRLFGRVRCTVTMDGKRWRWRSFSALAASTVEQIGLGFKPFLRCREKPGTFQLLGVIGSPGSLIPSLPKAFFGRAISRKKFVAAVARRAVVEAREPLPYTLDGENYPGAKKVRLRAGPEVEIIVR